MNEQPSPSKEPVVIKKYANRRLYNTSTSAYVTLEDLADMVKQGIEFTVHDAKTGEDITRSVLTQIIFEEENKGQNLLPIKFLRQLIRFYGDQMQAFVPSFLEMSLEQLTREQQSLRNKLLSTMGVNSEHFKVLDEQVKKNMTLFEDAIRVFNPFAPAAKETRSEGNASTPARGTQPSASDLRSLQEQLREMQRKLDSLSGKNS